MSVDVDYPHAPLLHYAIGDGEQAMILRQYGSSWLCREPEFNDDEVYVTIKSPQGTFLRYNRSQLKEKMKWDCSKHIWIVTLNRQPASRTIP